MSYSEFVMDFFFLKVIQAIMNLGQSINIVIMNLSQSINAAIMKLS